MLKGYVFKGQIFESQIFAFFVDTFLNGQCGIGNFGNNMEVTYSGNNVTIQDGLACIRGRFVGEDSSKTINIGTEMAFCRLVIEIDLSKENTEEVLNQVSYKIVKGASDYPNLTQTDIVKNNTGIYQFELARFKNTSAGITNFEDRRTYIDLENVFAVMERDFNVELEKFRTEIGQVRDGSAYVLKSTILSGTEEPTNDIGNDGDLYIQYVEQEE